MVSVLGSRQSGLGSNPCLGHWVAFLNKTLDSHTASLYPGAYIGTGELNAGG